MRGDIPNPRPSASPSSALFCSVLIRPSCSAPYDACRDRRGRMMYTSYRAPRAPRWPSQAPMDRCLCSTGARRNKAPSDLARGGAIAAIPTVYRARAPVGPASPVSRRLDAECPTRTDGQTDGRGDVRVSAPETPRSVSRWVHLQAETARARRLSRRARTQRNPPSRNAKSGSAKRGRTGGRGRGQRAQFLENRPNATQRNATHARDPASPASHPAIQPSSQHPPTP